MRNCRQRGWAVVISGRRIAQVGMLGFLGLWCWAAPALAQWLSTDSRVLETVARGQVNWTEGLVLGRESAPGSTRAGAGIVTGQVAAQAARQQLRTVLAQVRLDAKHTLGEGLRQVEAAQQQLATLAAQAEVVDTRYVAGGTVEVAVQVTLAGQLTALVLPAGMGVRVEGTLAGEAVHTGIVIDARGLALQPALLPRIVDDHGQAVYAPETVETEAAVQQGYVAYAKNAEQAPAHMRIGERPLVLRALRVADTARVDLVLSQADAARLRDYAATRRLLQQCRVLILM